jgi:hypothetical protein
MPDVKASGRNNMRLEQELEEPSRPLYVHALHAFFTVFFAVYDALVFIPFKIFADPEKKREKSERVKVKGFIDYLYSVFRLAQSSRTILHLVGVMLIVWSVAA